MMTQEQAIIKYLKKHKRVSGLDLVRDLGVLSYTKRMSLIRLKYAPQNGYVLVTERKQVKTRYGHTNVAVYSLIKKK